MRELKSNDREIAKQFVVEAKRSQKYAETQGPGGESPRKVWTKLSKEKVVREAIEQKGYRYSETDESFYVMESLTYVSVSMLCQYLVSKHWGPSSDHNIEGLSTEFEHF